MSFAHDPHRQNYSDSDSDNYSHSVQPLPLDPNAATPFFVQALYAYSGVDTSSLSFQQGDLIEVLSTLPSGWWDGVICEQRIRGWFPSNYVRRVSEEDSIWAKEHYSNWDGESYNNEERRGSTSSVVSADGGQFVGGVVGDYSSLMSGNGTGRAEQSLEEIMGGEDLNFSSGGDIFGEIAAAAQASSSSNSTAPHASDEPTSLTLYHDQRRPSGPTSVGHDGEVEDDDYWVPKMTKSGQLFYFNTRTSETSRDMPIGGQGDGVQIDLEELSKEEDSSIGTAGDLPADWTTQLSADGSTIFYYNQKTEEKSWTRPGVSTPADHLVPPTNSRMSTGASLVSNWTDRTLGADVSEQAERLKRASFYSDDSALDADFGGEKNGRDRKGKEVDRNEVPATETSEKKTPTRTKGKKAVSTSQLLEPPPPPLLTELETLVTTALHELISAAGVGGMTLRMGSEDVDLAAERNRLAVLGDGVVTSVRTLLHSSGVLEQVLSTDSTTSPAMNEITGAFPRSASLPLSALVELRPYTRRVTSTLSKLVLSVRAVWGLLETHPDDQVLDELDPTLPVDEEEATRRSTTRAAMIAGWAQARETRFELEAKLRSEVLAGARDVQIYVNTFLTELEKVVGANTASVGGPLLPKSMLRSAKSLQGSLRTNAGALLLPGGGFGGNWRGNGFVTLPSPHSTPAMPSSNSGLFNLSYTYPSKPITSEVAAALIQDSAVLIQAGDSLSNVITGLVTPLSRQRSNSVTSLASVASSRASTSLRDLPSTQLLKQSADLQRQIAVFLTKVEDIDVAANIDFELTSETSSSRPGSRRDFASATSTASPSTDSPKESDVESLLDPPAKEYRKSVQEARPLLGELEVRKQGLYDVAPALLTALQELFLLASPTADSPITGPQPLPTSPLAFFAPPTRAEFGPATILEVLSELKASVNGLCTVMTSLGAIADVQAAAPRDLRQASHPFRSSLFDPSTSPSASSMADSRLNGAGKPARSSMSHVTGMSPASSRHSLQRQEEDLAEFSSNSRESVDSDFFFSNVGSGARPSNTGSSRTTQPQSPSSNWDKRPRSVATSISSTQSQSENYPYRRTPLNTVDSDPMTPPATSSVKSSSKSKLAKLLGTEMPAPAPRPTTTQSTSSIPVPEPTPSWLGADYGPDEVSFNMEGQIKGGTLRALVIAAASHEGRVDSNYLSAFLMTYRTFCDPNQLLDFLIQRFLIEPPQDLNAEQLQVWESRKLKPIRARVANVLKSWVREHMDHDMFDGDLLRRIADFAASTMRDPVQSPQIIKAVEDRLSGAAPRQVGNLAPGLLPASYIPRNFRKLKFIDIEPLELARQLTLMDGRLFGRITPQECLGKAWPKEYGSEAPNISAMIDMSNAVTRWVTETILVQDDLKKRAATIKHFVLVAERCLALNNFSTLIHIIAGLNSTPIHRLRRTWEAVSQKSMLSLGMLNNLMKPDKNYKEYREALRGVAPPCVPFLGVYLTDWTFIGDGNSDMLREKPHQINFNKRQKASELILQIKLHQSTTYNLSAVPGLVKYLEEQLFPKESSGNAAKEDQRLYEISLMREPRERDDEKIARLLSESGFL